MKIWNAKKPEWAIAAGVILIILSLVLPAVWKYRIMARRMSIGRTMSEVILAATKYYVRYGVWPSGQTGASVDVRYGQKIPNREVINVLRAVDGPGNEGHRLNIGREVFLRVQPFQKMVGGVDSSGELLDPWGTPYQIVMDTDYSSLCDVDNSAYSGGIGEGVIVWSCGPDRISDTADDILSWDRSEQGKRYQIDLYQP